MIDGLADVQKAGRESMDRALQSFGALSRRRQALANEAAARSRQAFEKGAAHVEAHLEKLLGARSLDVVVAGQSDFVKRSYENAVHEPTRFGQLYPDIVRDVVRPFESTVPATAK